MDGIEEEKEDHMLHLEPTINKAELCLDGGYFTLVTARCKAVAVIRVRKPEAKEELAHCESPGIAL